LGTAPNLKSTPNANYIGSDSFTFKVNDGKVDSDKAVITITNVAEPKKNTNISVTGKVADGYIVGATVCLDLNHNEECNQNEPTTTTKAGGEYNLIVDSGINIANYSVVASVPKGAIDEDTGQAIEKPYTLSAPKGVIKFISPVSTLVKQIQLDGSLSLEEAKNQYKLKVNLSDKVLDVTENYIDSSDLTQENKDKLHNIAKVTAKIMAENQEPILLSLNESGLNIDNNQQKCFSTVNQHIITQLPIISNMQTVSDESIKVLPTKIQLDDLYKNLELNPNEQQSFAGSLVKNSSLPPKTNIINGSDDVGNGTILNGISYFINIVDGEEVTKYFTVSQEKQQMALYIENLKNNIDFDVYKKDGSSWKRINYDIFDTNPTKYGMIYLFGKEKIDYENRLENGEYKIVFDDSNGWFSDNSAIAKVFIEGDLFNIKPVRKFAFAPLSLDVTPYKLASNETKSIYGTLSPYLDSMSNNKVIDIIPLRSENYALNVNLEVKGNVNLDVEVVDATYASKILNPSLNLENNAILFKGKAKDLKNKTFTFNKQDTDNAYYVIISESSENMAWYYYLASDRYELIVKTSDLKPVTFNIGNTLYTVDSTQKNALSLISSIAIKDSNNLLLPNNHFYDTVDKAKQLTSSYQTLHSVLNFDEVAMKRFYDDYVKTIDGVNLSRNLMTSTEILTSVAFTAYKIDPRKVLDKVSLSLDIVGGMEKLLLMGQNERAKVLGRNFLEDGYVILQEYATRKKAFLAKYNNGEVVLSDTSLSQDALNELSQLYILQERARRFVMYGMEVYMSATELEERNFLQYARDRVIDILLSSLPESIALTMTDFSKKIIDISKEGLNVVKTADKVNEIEKGYADMYMKLLDQENYFSFYDADVQALNIKKLQDLGYVFNIVENIGTSLLKKTGQTTSYYAGDDGYYQTGVTPSYTRDDSKEIVTDNITGLMWQDNSEAKTLLLTWQGAMDYCDGLTLGEYNDWRLPAVEELESIVDYGRSYLVINQAFVNVEDHWYWSSTSFSGGTNVSFSSGDVGNGIKDHSGCLRCVRAGR